ncbi:hypothetical protein C8F01DRAFT_1240356, partial [Mycena amicta]
MRFKFSINLLPSAASIIAVFTFSVRSCVAAIFENVVDLQNVATTFDFIVVGGLKEGLLEMLSRNRLSENGTFSVLVLEAGGSNTGILDLSAPLLCILATPFTAQDWNYTTVPQAALNNRVIPYPRGFVLGGSSSVTMVVGCIVALLEKDRAIYATGRQPQTQTRQFDPAVHGFNGINSVTLSGFPTEIDSKVIGTTSLEGEFPFNLDMNSGYPLRHRLHADDGVEWLAEQLGDVILLHARVTRILPTATNDFRTVEFRDARGQIFNLTATKEVILSAGSVNSPTILMHSEWKLYSALVPGITPLHNLPSVGQNLSEPPTLPSPEHSGPNTKTGRVGAEPITQLGWLASQTTRLSFRPFPIPRQAPIPRILSCCLRMGLLASKQRPYRELSDIAVAVVSTASRGAKCIPICRAQPFAGYITAPWPPNGLSSASTDDEVDAFVRAGAGTIFHPVGTAGMSPVGADYGVVDPDLRVKGLNGLRIVDLSVLPRIPAAHTQASAYVIGERAADMIKDSCPYAVVGRDTTEDVMLTTALLVGVADPEIVEDRLVKRTGIGACVKVNSRHVVYKPSVAKPPGVDSTVVKDSEELALPLATVVGGT